MQQALIEKYGEARLPRYTSYPTAPRFSTNVDAATYADWLAAIRPGTDASLYLHIPFCRSMCWYCGCHTTITRRDEPVRDYIDILRREIELVGGRAKAGMTIRHVHFGGGTPTIMQPQEFSDLMALLRQRFSFAVDAEVAVEIDPRTLTDDMAIALGAAGVTRASLGVQSFDSVVQKAINRMQSEEQTAATMQRLKQAGIGGINFDLIYGLPYQTVESCVATATTAIAMRPERFAVFGYAHIPSFKKHQKLIYADSLPDAALRNEQAEAIAATLTAAGYVRIGLDHYALPSDELASAALNGTLRRNFQGYTTDECDTLISFGASSIGRTEFGYVQNEVAPGLYAQRISAGELATVKGYQMTTEDRMRAEIIERLMCDFQVDVTAIADRHGFAAEPLLDNNARLEQLIADGIVTREAGRIVVKQDQRFLIRAVAACFDAYLEQMARQFSTAA